MHFFARFVHISYSSLLVLPDELAQMDVSSFLNNLVAPHEVERNFISCSHFDIPVLCVQPKSAFFGRPFLPTFRPLPLAFIGALHPLDGSKLLNAQHHLLAEPLR